SRGVDATAAWIAEAVLRAGPVARAVDREAAGAGGGHEEVDEGVEERELAAVLDRPEALRQVRDDVGGEHLDDEHQRDRAGEQAEHDQEAAERLEDAGEAEQGEELRGPAFRPEAAEPAEQLLDAVLHEEQARNDPQDAVG